MDTIYHTDPKLEEAGIAMRAGFAAGRKVGRKDGLMQARTIISRMQQWRESTRVQDAALAEAIRAIEAEIAE